MHGRFRVPLLTIRGLDLTHTVKIKEKTTWHRFPERNRYHTGGEDPELCQSIVLECYYCQRNNKDFKNYLISRRFPGNKYKTYFSIRCNFHIPFHNSY